MPRRMFGGAPGSSGCGGAKAVSNAARAARSRLGPCSPRMWLWASGAASAPAGSARSDGSRRSRARRTSWLRGATTTPGVIRFTQWPGEDCLRRKEPLKGFCKSSKVKCGLDSRMGSASSSVPESTWRSRTRAP